MSIIRRNGFTIVELLIVIVVIGILAAIIIVTYNGFQDRAGEVTLKSDLRSSAGLLEIERINNGSYPATASGIKASQGTSYQYTLLAADAYCLTATSSRTNIPQFKISQSKIIESGACAGHTTPPSGGIPSGYESAPTASGGSTSIEGYNAIQPASCPSVGGSWVKVPGNSLYGQTNGFCVQQYPASNVSGVATSKPTGPRWTALTQAVSKTTAEAVDTNTHLLSESEWMTIASNAAAQPQNWSGGSLGSGTLPRGSATAAYGGVSVTLSNGSVVYFDTGSGSYYASNEWTCYTGTNASSCGLAAQYQPIPANAFYTDQFGLFTNYNSFATNGAGRYYGDPRYGNTSLNSYVTSARDKGLGYLRSSYAAGSGTVYGFNRGSWTGATSSGLFTLYVYTVQSSYAHATYGFRAAK